MLVFFLDFVSASREAHPRPAGARVSFHAPTPARPWAALRAADLTPAWAVLRTGIRSVLSRSARPFKARTLCRGGAAERSSATGSARTNIAPRGPFNPLIRVPSPLARLLRRLWSSRAWLYCTYACLFHLFSRAQGGHRPFVLRWSSSIAE